MGIIDGINHVNIQYVLLAVLIIIVIVESKMMSFEIGQHICTFKLKVYFNRQKQRKERFLIYISKHAFKNIWCTCPSDADHICVVNTLHSRISTLYTVHESESLCEINCSLTKEESHSSSVMDELACVKAIMKACCLGCYPFPCLGPAQLQEGPEESR